MNCYLFYICYLFITSAHTNASADWRSGACGYINTNYCQFSITSLLPLPCLAWTFSNVWAASGPAFQGHQMERWFSNGGASSSIIFGSANINFIHPLAIPPTIRGWQAQWGEAEKGWRTKWDKINKKDLDFIFKILLEVCILVCTQMTDYGYIVLVK